MSDSSLIVWDLETTGFVAPEAKILEIGAFIIRDDQIEQKHWVFKNEGIEIPEEITKITGIDQAIIDAEGRDPKECLNEFLPLLKESARNITHNGIRFDIPFLINTVVDILKISMEETIEMTEFLRSNAFDTAVHFKASKLRMKPGRRETFAEFADRVMAVRAFGLKYNLGACCDDMKVDRANVVQHRALGDVSLTYEIYKILSLSYDTRTKKKEAVVSGKQQENADNK